MRIEDMRERRTGSCPRERFLANDEGMDVRVKTSGTAHVVEADKLILEIWAEEQEKGTCLVCSGLE